MAKLATALLMVLAAAMASLAAARPMAGAGRRLLQVAPATTTYNVEWDLAYVPYPRLSARCGDLITFRWEGSLPQTVSMVQADSDAAALAECSLAVPLTDPSTSGEYTEEVLTPGTMYFVEPNNCGMGQILVVSVVCEDAPALSILDPGLVAEQEPAPAVEALTAAEAPAATEAAAAPAPAPLAA